MQARTLVPPALAAGAAALVLVPAASHALQSLGWSLPLSQRDVRLNPPMLADLQGGMLRRVDFTMPPADAGPGQILPSSVFDFQYGYRDPAAGASGFNLSNGMHAVFCP